MIWPGNAMASALILFAIAHAFLYAARKLVHDLFRSIGHAIAGPCGWARAGSSRRRGHERGAT